MARLTSLLLVEERLLEAEYFAKRLSRQSDRDRYGYELNAFLSAARSVTFLVQKELSKVEGFEAWWVTQRELMRADAVAKFFLELRNFSQKQGRVSLVGGSNPPGSRSRWTYCFAGTVDPVPAELLHRDVADCCREHVAKLAALILRCAEQFPFQACPAKALTPEGVDTLRLNLDDFDEALGFPRGATDVQAVGRDERIRMMRQHVDGLDFRALRRLARWRPAISAEDASTVLGGGFLAALVDRFEMRRTEPCPGDPVLEALALQILKQENGREPA